ncbi:extracellular catalytic domain type 1 short-chain-length polyhydroxyalkanoate depolymerase [Lichenifustis flavocetrariae]|uniref:PHB depolymerase family esterase n=1 Tax=Lichenifustis flavocetrariae TaxID=2949735 RepID=A0AA41Z2Z4_9HYPH|nr:PHB depolymerase family esterase [Lichenifustis flavocetrariae]MCW6508337.1 PHB depolymerase family esterase [Lichenifustis flavocetrariae]
MNMHTDLMARLAGLQSSRGLAGVGADRLDVMAGFGSNPGNLGAKVYVPPGLPDHAPLVVVLHGCTQTAGGYDNGAGWSSLADLHGFALLYPEQQRGNNPNGCFNWFEPGDTRRDAGEALSIRQMVAHMLDHYRLDPERVFITGLSAGGAMASAMLATYPEVFAGGAIIAGLPYGCASSVPEAFERMRGGNAPTEQVLGKLVRAASGHEGPWPRVSIWQGTADYTVDHSNADVILDQWRNVHRLAPTPDRTEMVDGYPRRVWVDADGRDLVEEFRIAGMGHGTPLATRGLETCGESGAYMLDVSISSTHHIARFWGLIGPGRETHATFTTERGREPTLDGLATAEKPEVLEAAGASRLQFPLRFPASGGVDPAKVIEDALRAAGLMR